MHHPLTRDDRLGDAAIGKMYNINYNAINAAAAAALE
jgi:hypothetical protein